ncbi:hypothetical protein CN581_26940 [Bacillus toyonensis]|uniref:hypothetical protein n=1 Tax=Bacillus toyonensis TaxID=155322 RepID=UPI000BF85E9D|nr:hypothetical protein [Bacillus toyonensis]PEP75443.1 hypothetical protein CN581_26940 [Bacillus toyonensis]
MNTNYSYKSFSYDYDLEYFLPSDYPEHNKRLSIIDYGPQLCSIDKPCITDIYKQGPNIIIAWSDVENRDRYNFRWGRPGMQEKQLQLAGGNGGQFILKNFRHNTLYTFKVQGCTTHFLSSSSCTPWDIGGYQT